MADKGFILRRGQLALVAAGPGTGKSAFALTQALKSRVPTLYLSADSDAFVQLTRSLSILMGWTLEQSARAVLRDDLGAAQQVLAGLPIRFEFSASPTLDQIELTMAAYEEVYGSYPTLVVVDNITNVQAGLGEDEGSAGLDRLMDYLSTMARETRACVLGLHHVTSGFNDADKPVPLSGVKNQVSRVPALIGTMFKPVRDEWSEDVLCFSKVKDRNGRADPSGHDYVELRFAGDRMLIEDMAA
ncbi:AAA family ATPase [Kutzneria chonburiensis]|uniref:AAA family ATPase n=1 Tax=Kutzneria chonburiensis TaxID=1483604 RepID=A0ABV6N3F3_9PSEU|nr:AAA family ATPase [Kutzneria chonburiensis]